MSVLEVSLLDYMLRRQWHYQGGRQENVCNSLVFWLLRVLSNCQKTRLSQTYKSNISYAVTVFNSLAIAHIKAQSSRAMEQIMIWFFLPLASIFR